MNNAKRVSTIFSKLGRRITGVSSPWFGLQWTTTVTERECALKLLAFLEDRRVLFNPEQLEVQGECERSVHAIREQCTLLLQEAPEESGIAVAIRMVRKACREFLDEARPDYRSLYEDRFHIDKSGASFFTGLGELRAKIGLQVGVVAARFDISLEDGLKSVSKHFDWETE